jgi:hypothetical protein
MGGDQSSYRGNLNSDTDRTNELKALNNDDEELEKNEIYQKLEEILKHKLNIMQ